MRTLLMAAAAVIALGALSLPAAAQSYNDGYGPGYGDDQGYGPGDGVPYDADSGGYCDDYGCPDDFWDMPVYYGPVYFGDEWFDGPLYYRDWYGSRQFWIHGGWHSDQWRGPRPNWWHQGRIGPALGMGFYQNHGFHGRWDNRGGWNNRGGAYRNDWSAGRGALDRRDDFRGQGNGGQRDGFRDRGNAAPNVQSQPGNDGGGWRGRNNVQVQPQAAPQQFGADGHHRDGNRNGGWRGQNNAQPQQQPQQQAAPQQPVQPAPSGDDHHHDRGDHGDWHH